MSNIADIHQKVVSIIAEISDIAEEKITLEANMVTDLAIDSLDFLDIVFAIDKAYNIHLPVEKWLQDINNSSQDEIEHFTIMNICKEIEKLSR